MALLEKDIGKDCKVRCLLVHQVESKKLPFDPQYPFTIVGLKSNYEAKICLSGTPEIILCVSEHDITLKPERKND